jgi:subtilase family serine protease
MNISRFRRTAPGAASTTVPRRAARRLLGPASVIAAGLAVVAAGLTLPAAAATSATAGAAGKAAPARPASRPGPSAYGFRAACPSAPAGHFRCFAIYRPQASVNRAIAVGVAGKASRPVGLTPRELEQAYRLPVSRASDQTVAVSIAYNTPHLAAYLAKYRQYFGLPPCTVASGCFRVVNEYGNANPKRLPSSGVDSGWDLEVTLDVSMISTACPHCKIIVVEGKSTSFADLARTDDTAVRLGAEVVSNSYGGRENGYAMAYAKSYDHPGHTIVASAGDYGYTAANFPAALSTVTAVGGTQLARAKNSRGWWEQAWNDDLGAGGSGCSAYVPKPAWQHDPHCPGRTVADVSAAAANVPIYNPTYGGWISVDGTSVAAPLIAGIYGLAGNAATIPLGYAYSHRQFLFDVTRGTNSWFWPSKDACGNDYLCVAKKGYDAPTGLGTPDGIGAF